MSRLAKLYEARVVKHTLCDDIRKRLMTNPSKTPCQIVGSPYCRDCCIGKINNQQNLIPLVRLLDE